jgi:hypothetical protein
MMWEATKKHISAVTKKFGAAVVLAMSLAAAGCVPHLPAPVNYSPSSALTAAGTVKVEDFRYLPALNGKVAPNQLRNTAMGDFKIDKNIDGFFRDAVFKEFRFVGIKVDGTNRVITGDINDFLVDDLGYSVDWTIDVNYVVKDAATSKVVYSATKITKNKTAKFVNVFGTLNDQIRLNIEELLKDPDFIRAIN